MQKKKSLRAEELKVINDALVKFPKSADLLDEIATMYLMQRNYPEAISFFESSEKIDPKRGRTLNNLAMALSEMPMRRQEAVAKIERAIALYGRAPDLLDTLGQVYFRSERIEQAIAVLKEALGQKNDNSFRIHLAQCLVQKKDFCRRKATVVKNQYR